MLEPVRASQRTGEPIRWTKVHDLPDFTYFNHSIHVAKGVGCAECHGRVDTMALTYRAVPLTMQFCLDCHRDPGKRLRPRDEITNMDWKPAGDRDALAQSLLHDYGIRVGALTHCTVCHR